MSTIQARHRITYMHPMFKPDMDLIIHVHCSSWIRY